MSDRREERLTTLLEDRADRVQASGDAWIRIRERIEADDARRSWLVPALAATGLAAAVVVGIVVLQGPAELTILPDAATTTPGTTASPTTSTTGTSTASPPSGTTPTPARTSYSFDTVALATETEFASGEGIAARGVVVVVVGEDDGRAIVWRSGDGARTWERIDLGLSGALEDVVATDEGFFAAGAGDASGVWQSEDGRAWTRAFESEGGTLYGITDGPNGLVAVGDLQLDPRRGHVLHRLDGEWRPASSDDGSFDPARGGETVLYQVTSGAGSYVATGYGPDQALTDLWFSEDGAVWEHLDEPGLGISSDVGVLDVLTWDRDGGYLAVQAGGEVYRSEDGRRWTSTGFVDAERSGEPGFRFYGARHTERGWLLVGGVADATTIQAWTSPDAVTWTPIGETSGKSLTIAPHVASAGPYDLLIPLEVDGGLVVWRARTP